jgi:hypothetical protein
MLTDAAPGATPTGVATAGVAVATVMAAAAG